MKTKFALALAALIMSQSAFAVYDRVVYPTPGQEIGSYARILSKLASTSKGGKLGTVEIPTGHLLESIEKDPRAEAEFIVRFRSQFEGRADVCVAIVHVFLTKKVETTAVSCD